MKILLLKEESDSRDKLSFAIESRYRAKVESAATLEAGLRLLKTAAECSAPYEFLICDLKSTALSNLQEFLKNTAESLPAILCDEGKELSHQVSPTWNVIGMVNRSSLITSLFQVIDSKYGNVASAQSANETEKYCKIRAKILLSVCPLKGDVFIRLSESKYVKLFHKGAAFERTDWIKYSEQKGVEYLYIKLDQCAEFIEKYRLELEKTLELTQNMSLKESAHIQDSIHETVQEMGLRIGFTKDVQVLAKTQIRIAVKAMQGSKDLGSILERLEKEQGKYISAHSTLTGYLACAIASQMEWGSDATMYKLNMAAFLHDITLENESLALCESIQEADEGGFTEAERTEFKSHSAKAAAIARTFTEVPPDVDAIILQHHETVDGTGFPRGIGHTYISPLAAVFIVAHEMANRIILGKERFDLKSFIYDFSASYSKGNFKKVMEAVKLLRMDPPPGDGAGG